MKINFKLNKEIDYKSLSNRELQDLMLPIEIKIQNKIFTNHAMFVPTYNHYCSEIDNLLLEGKKEIVLDPIDWGIAPVISRLSPGVYRVSLEREGKQFSETMNEEEILKILKHLLRVKENLGIKFLQLPKTMKKLKYI